MKLPKKNVRYVDLPEVSETFADSLGLSTFDGQSVRIELCVTRLDEPNPPKSPTARKYPACRLVLTPQVAVDLFKQLNGFIEIMKKEGLIKTVPPPKETTH
jgi:hypothetical protein